MIEIMDDMTSDLKCNGKMFDIGTGIGISVNEVAKIIVNLTGSKSSVLHTDMRLGEPEMSIVVADISQHPLNTQVSSNFFKGLKKTIEHYKESGMV